ncbi:AGAP001583-PA-like protein [Anopheles sinensis]|uniref:Wiskott-Aldrich syndrome protein family member n=1 Tax=Anopheles sinensis TaxID=74873 RepID=A0A084WSR0_ANOSI|nr:AGAP001583-PA-like protein [Anopheles sinensis]
MPFVQRVVTPKYIARSSKLALQPYAAAPTIPVADNEFEALTNITLSNALRQLASLVFISNQIFTELHQELTSVSERSVGLRQRLDRLSEKVESFDPKQIKQHHKTHYHVDTSLFTVATRSETVQGMYEAAAKTPPTAVQDLRKWTSSEAIGDVTTGVSCSVKIASNSTTNNSVLPNISEASADVLDSAQPTTSSSANHDTDIDAITTLAESLVRSDTSDDRIDHLLPSPDEQCRILASKFPAETIKIDTSGRPFDRMSSTRRSALVCYAPRPKKDDSKPEEDTVRRRSRLRRPRGKRRNTIAGTDQREIAEVISKGYVTSLPLIYSHFGDWWVCRWSHEMVVLIMLFSVLRERKSSLTKLNRSNSTASNGTLERSYSSSTLGSTLDSTGTIKRNGVLIQKEVLKILRQENNNRLDVADGNAPKTPAQSGAEKQPEASKKLPPTAEPEQSESSDVECVERTERLKVKTTINTSRIPSMCIITPTNSDDEHDTGVTPKVVGSTRKTPTASSADKSTSKRPSLTESTSFELKKPKDFRKHSLLPLNSVLDRIKGALPHLKKSPTKEEAGLDGSFEKHDNDGGGGGEYVEIAKGGGRKTPNELTVRRNLATVLSGNLNEETEYVSLNELPCNMKCESGNFLLVDDKCASVAVTLQQSGQDGAGSCTVAEPTVETPQMASGATTNNGKVQPHAAALKGAARVKLDANGRVIFSSDSLKRRKGAHTTFAPGPCVKDVSSREAQCKQNLVLRQHRPLELGDGAVGDGASTSVNASAVTVRPAVIPTVRQLKRPLVSARYGAFGSGNRIVPSIAAGAPSSSILEPGAKKTLVATILPNSAKSQQPPPQREPRELSNMQSFSPSYSSTTGPTISSNVEGHHTAPLPATAATTPTATFYKGAQVNVQSVAAASYQPTLVGHAKPYPEGAHSLDRSSIRNWYPDKLTIGGRSGLPTRSVESRVPRGYPALHHSDYEPPKALLAGGFCSPQPASSPQPPPVVEGDSIVDPHSLYAIPNKPKPSPLTVGSRIAAGSRPTDRSLRSILAEQSSELSPIKPCQSNPFKTSTPSKEDELTMQWQNRLLSSPAVRSLGSSPVHSGRSTPREMLEPQTPRGRHSWASNSVEVPKTCSDRLGTPKTSLMDFKKLLLAHGTKSHASPGSKMSAVEMLKKSKEAAAAASANRPQETPGSPGGGMAILDMSASPKMYSFRRIAQQGNYGGSPTKGSGGKGVGSRSNWRYNNMRTGVISTAIPEANSEEDIQPIDRSKSTEESEPPGSNSKGPIPPEKMAQLASDLEQTISSIKENIFLKEDENNFMKGEVPRMAKSFAGFSTTPASADGHRGRLVKELGAKFGARTDQKEGTEMNEAEKLQAAAALETAL